jgi:hypothetical protein
MWRREDATFWCPWREKEEARERIGGEGGGAPRTGEVGSRDRARRWASVPPLGTVRGRRLRRRHAGRLYQVAGGYSQNVQFTDEAYRRAVHALSVSVSGSF